MTDIKAEVGGVLTHVACEAGAHVTQGANLFFIESMKMEIPAAAPRDGEIERVLVRAGDAISEGQVLAVLVDA
ncbi:biotin/lipoyl-binding protein [Aeromicrobium sp. 636]|uniref:Acetyl-CoA carboxylase biotin carboxyl carrier protein subunit n=1 Tax=Aeromicrobium senzhongii TaxID=2663859 RepID=A0A8I0EWE7_9ACTN|nr:MULTISPECIES: acetyl-CoA carboxylase biotin carboxyl carrier protein subunit [Aeromicrobium]MBC9227490.1 acetyl-CoA carboxylase biotin carboxyl carrier protein subunit [Aeromicrobium senzhongii]MCQ3999587.1 biotin/lipoyl-binding protein [Aeromicrobium sp. 636]